jgi:hydrogenase/urease accessory protein HupE
MRFLLLFICVLLPIGVLDAHEIGTTRVSVSIRQNASYEIEVATDAAALFEKLETVSGAPAQSELKSYDDIFRRRVGVLFDGAPVHPSIDYTVSGTATPTSPPIAVIKLRGTIPKGATQLEWTYSWTFATYSLTIETDGGPQTTEWLEGGQRSTPLSLAAMSKPAHSRSAIAIQYFALGFTHIVPKGLDHMLFVLGIFLLGRRMRQILGQISAFTIAHSITLALSVYGVISISPKIVEPLIAISIVYVAIENIFLSDLKPWRVALVFAFGLLHGMGFAGALRELGLPRSEFVTALLTFNLGVEAGQLAVIGAAFLLVGWYCARRHWYRRLIVVPASVLIACTAMCWTFQRLP